MGRPRKYASASEKQAAYRDRYAVFEIRLIKETATTLDKLAETLDVSRNEVVNSLINFALLNRSWFTQGLFGKRLPYSKNPAGLYPGGGLTARQEVVRFAREHGLGVDTRSGGVVLTDRRRWIEAFDNWDEAHLYLQMQYIASIDNDTPFPWMNGKTAK